MNMCSQVQHLFHAKNSKNIYWWKAGKNIGNDIKGLLNLLWGNKYLILMALTIFKKNDIRDSCNGLFIYIKSKQSPCKYFLKQHFSVQTESMFHSADV